MRQTRRSFLASAAAATVALGATGSATASDHEYDVIQARGQVIRIDDGQTWENKLIDLGDGNDITVVATGTDWTIRNVGITGTWHHTTHEYIFSLADTGGGTGTFENIYAGDGDPDASGRQRGGVVWVSSDHSGRLEVTNVNFNIEGAIGIYGSSPGSSSSGGRGTIHIDGCFAQNNHHTAYRVSDNGDTITNSSVRTTGDRPAARALWIWECPDGPSNGGATLRNLNLDLNGGTAAIAEKYDPVIQRDGISYGSAPIPDGCPTSAEEAATGANGGEEQPWADDEHYIHQPDGDNWEKLITLNFSEGSGDFTVHADDEIYQGYFWEGYQEYTDGLEFTNREGYYGVTGSESGGSVALVTDGELTGVDIDGEGYEVWMNGEQIDPAEYNEHPPEEDQEETGDNDEDEEETTEWWEELFGGDRWWADGPNDDGAWLKDFLYALERRLA